MNKQELIDKAVEQFCGKYPAKCQENIILSYRAGKEEKKNSYYPFYVWHSESEYDICTKIEFEQRARELGWISGYKYGVEYETNGKKPDLDDDVIVEFRNKQGIWKSHSKDLNQLKNWDWRKSLSFRIVDERHKPVESAASNEVEQVRTDWYDYDKQRAIVLPPVGVECEIWEFDEVWRKCEVIAHTKKGLVVEWQNKEFLVASDRKFRPLGWNRKAEAEKRKFIDDALACLTEFRSANQVFAELYDAGCRFTENKAAS